MSITYPQHPSHTQYPVAYNVPPTPSPQQVYHQQLMSISSDVHAVKMLLNNQKSIMEGMQSKASAVDTASDKMGRLGLLFAPIQEEFRALEKKCCMQKSKINRLQSELDAKKSELCCLKLDLVSLRKQIKKPCKNTAKDTTKATKEDKVIAELQSLLSTLQATGRVQKIQQMLHSLKQSGKKNRCASNNWAKT